MFWTLIIFALGWYVGRNWEQVKRLARDKMSQSKTTKD